jgi:hypothetical protein
MNELRAVERGGTPPVAQPLRLDGLVARQVAAHHQHAAAPHHRTANAVHIRED